MIVASTSFLDFLGPKQHQVVNINQNVNLSVRIEVEIRVAVHAFEALGLKCCSQMGSPFRVVLNLWKDPDITIDKCKEICQPRATAKANKVFKVRRLGVAV